MLNLVFVCESKIEEISDVKQKYLVKPKLVTRNRSGGKAESRVLETKDTSDNQSVGKRTRKRSFCHQCACSAAERSWEKKENLPSKKPRRCKSWISRRTAIKLSTFKQKAAGVKFPTTYAKIRTLSDRKFSGTKNTKQEDDMFQKIKPKWNGMLLQKSSRALVNSDSSETEDLNQQTGPRSPTLPTPSHFGKSHLHASTPKEITESSLSPMQLTKKQEAVFLKRRNSDRTSRRQKARESLQFPVRKQVIFCQDVPPSYPNLGTSDLTLFEELASVVKEATAVKEGVACQDVDLSAVESYFSDD